MSSPSVPSTASRSSRRSFRNPTNTGNGIFTPTALSPAGRFPSSRTGHGSCCHPVFGEDLRGSPPLPPEEGLSLCVLCDSDSAALLPGGMHADQRNVSLSGAARMANVNPVAISDGAHADVSETPEGSHDAYGKEQRWNSMNHSQPNNACISSCCVEGCSGNLMRTMQGKAFFPCECKYPICWDCYVDVLKEGSTCPGCREEYHAVDAGESPYVLSFRSPCKPTTQRALSLVKSTHREMVLSSKMFDFDCVSWLYETRGTFGYGNAFESYDSPKDNFGGMSEEFEEKLFRPLVQEKKICDRIIGPYRFVVLVRVTSLIFYLWWRFKNPNRKAMWLWSMSVMCELWFSVSWILNQLPKMMPLNRSIDLQALRDRFERCSTHSTAEHSDLPGIDIFVTTADPTKEAPLVTANSVLSILAVDYPAEKVACFLSDDSGSLLTFETLAEVATYARVWVPFCRKHDIEPRNPEAYFNTNGDATKNKVRKDFVRDRRRVKREYDECKVRINSLPDVIRRRSDACNAYKETNAKRAQVEKGMESFEKLEVQRATWMADGNCWPGTWDVLSDSHTPGDHASIIQVMLRPPNAKAFPGESEYDNSMDLTGIDRRIPMLVYVSREKRPGYDHKKKAGALNALIRASALLSNAPFILNLDCDHYVHNSQAVRVAMCLMLEAGGEDISFVQFPQRFMNIDPNDRYANHNTVFFNGGMRALDGLQGPVNVGTGCIFRRTALCGFSPSRLHAFQGCFSCCCNFGGRLSIDEMEMDIMEAQTYVFKNVGASEAFLASISELRIQGQPGAVSFACGRPPRMRAIERTELSKSLVAEVISVISCWYEDKTDWGSSVGWIYGSVTEDILTGYHLHNRGWRSVYCVTKADAFRGTAPLNLTDRLHQVLRWATGSVEIFLSGNNSLFAGSQMKLLQRVAYFNISIAPFTSVFLVVYCFLPALSLLSNEFIVETVTVDFLIYLLLMTGTLCLIAMLEVRWSGISLEEWWRNEQFWVIKGCSADLVAVLHGLLKLLIGIDISFTLTSKFTPENAAEEFEDLYVIKWTNLLIPPLTIMIANAIAIAVAITRLIYSHQPDLTKLLGGIFFSMWVLLHLYPFAKGLTGKRGRTPTIIWMWASLLAFTISLLWVAIASRNPSFNTGFQL